MDTEESYQIYKIQEQPKLYRNEFQKELSEYFRENTFMDAYIVIYERPSFQSDNFAFSLMSFVPFSSLLRWTQRLKLVDLYFAAPV